MFRTIMALLVALITAILIGAFQILGLGVADIQTLLQSASLTNALAYQGGLLFAQLMLPYSMALSGIYGPLVALGVAGFVAGLISKNGIRMLIVSVITLVLFFVGYVALTMGASLQVDIIATIAKNIVIDLGVAFALLFVPGMIGASLTAEEY
ncbi:MAG: hypothetical protein K9W43_07340 [Candidatus Thorarchaeota archaeon]|nr:hypothetical protein [Candidatus Thorarchaeota archaeon]